MSHKNWMIWGVHSVCAARRARTHACLHACMHANPGTHEHAGGPQSATLAAHQRSRQPRPHLPHALNAPSPRPPPVRRAPQGARALRFVRKVPLLKGLSDNDLLRVAERMPERAYGDGQALIRYGERGDEMYLIRYGKVGGPHAHGPRRMQHARAAQRMQTPPAACACAAPHAACACPTPHAHARATCACPAPRGPSSLVGRCLRELSGAALGSRSPRRAHARPRRARGGGAGCAACRWTPHPTFSIEQAHAPCAPAYALGRPLLSLPGPRAGAVG